MKADKDRGLFFKRLEREIEGEVFADLFSRGRYATDASIYQCFPAGVVAPRTEADVAIIIEMAREERVSLIARGGGTSLAGQALGEGLIVDFSKHLNKIKNIDPHGRTCIVEPGARLSTLKEALRPHELNFPLDIASGATATIGGMFANNASGLRSLRYGRMADQVNWAEAYLADGQRTRFSEILEFKAERQAGTRDRQLDLLQFGELNEEAIRRLWVGSGSVRLKPDGYDLGALLPSTIAQNLSRLFAGSEGTLGFFTELQLKLSPRPQSRALGVCRFSSLKAAIATVPKIMPLNPSAVELLDGLLIEAMAAREGIEPQTERLLQGEPSTLLLVEFDEENPVENTRALKLLNDIVPQRIGDPQPGVIEVLGQKAQNAVWRLRRRALMRAFAVDQAAFRSNHLNAENLVDNKKQSAGQPIAFLEDIIVPLENLADYAAALEGYFEARQVRALIYGHAGEGILQVYPILNLAKSHDSVRLSELRADMAALIERYGGRLSSGHGLGLSRSDLSERFGGKEVHALCAETKRLLDPACLFNPGKILNAPQFDDPALLKAGHLDGPIPLSITSSWGGTTSSQKALEQASKCNGLSLCTSLNPKEGCPSYRVTHDEKDSPRGRANTMRLALLGQLGPDALITSELEETFRLCVSCKACKVACPSSVNIPKLKAEVRAAARKGGIETLAENAFAKLPEIADKARAYRHLLRLRDLIPALGRLSERKLGIAGDRPWPKWSGVSFKPKPIRKNSAGKPKVALFADTFNRAFEPQNLKAAAHVLEAAGYSVSLLADQDEPKRPLCCGRTYYDTGDFEKARIKAERLTNAISRAKDKGAFVVGLEPNCVLMARDEYLELGIASAMSNPPLLLEEFIAQKIPPDSLRAKFKAIEADILLHSHCHERAAGTAKFAEAALSLIPSLKIENAPPSCCGFNGGVGLTPSTLEASFTMAELELFPAIRKIGRDALIAATGYSCRKQILDGLGAVARHPALILDLALRGDAEIMT